MKRLGERRRSETIFNISSKEQDDKVTLSLPVDLIIEILTKLPPRSVSKLICVSKLWSSIIQGKLFNDLCITRSLTRPLLLFQFHCRARFYQYSSSPENPSSDHSFSPKMIPGSAIAPPVRGLICCRYDDDLYVGNPSTGQFLTLPRVKTMTYMLAIFFGYEPVNDLYKVFYLRSIFDKHGHLVSGEHQVFTLGAQKTWRMIECKCPHYPIAQGICKNGVVYYRAWSYSPDYKISLVSLDMKSEELNLMRLPDFFTSERYGTYDLVSYNGKIALVNESSNGKFDLWVLMDVNKQEWTKVSVVVPCWKNLVGNRLSYCRGTISTGELIIEPWNSACIIYYNPKEDEARRVDFERSGARYLPERIFVDHVESPIFLPRKV